MTSASSPRSVCILLAAIFAWAAVAQSGTFKNPALIDTTYDPIGVAPADFNRDGKLDLVYIDGLGSPVLHVLLGNGDGTFAHGQDISLPAGVCGYANCAINLADVTKDGNLDIILGSGILTSGGATMAQLAVLPGNGDGTFRSPIISSVPSLPMLNGQMAIGDVNGDGAMDIVAVSGYSLDVFLGDNSGKFVLKTSLTLYFGGGTTVYLNDLNGDGHLDIVANDLLGARTFVLLGNGDGTFQPFVSYNLTYAWLFADMDGDGHPDLVGSEYGQGVVVSKGNSDGTFGTPSVVASMPSDANLLAIADYNGDGTPDLVFATPLGINVAIGQGNLTYGTPISSVAGALATPFLALAELAPGDFNSDGRNDLAMGVDGGILILLGNGNGGFASADSYDVGHSVGVAAVADFNRDGKPDIAVTVPATYPRLLLGNGSGTFTLGADQNQSYTSQTPAGSLVAADFNGDGNPDLDFVQPSSSFPYGQTFVLFDSGIGTFSIPLGINTGPTLTADLNHDGRGDLVFLSNSGAITVLLGQANSTFTTVTTPQWQGAYGVAAIGDLNRDGKLDLLLYEDQALRLWLGNGDGTFSPSNLVTIPGQETYGIFTGQQVVIADLDGDGNGDIIITPIANPYNLLEPLLVLYGNGDGTFQVPQLIVLSRIYTQVVVADINGDSKPDLVLTDGSGIAVITNLGNRTFGAEDHYVAGQGIFKLNVVDVNGDGFPDIVAANSGGTTVTVLLNQPNGKPLDGAASNGTFTVTPAPSNYSQPVTLKIVMSGPAASATPTGKITFYVDGNYISDVALVSGSATRVYSPPLIPGTHTFVAAYNGDATYSPESFAALETVNPPVYPTSTALTASPSTALTSQTVRLTATVTSSVTVPAGWVTFLDGANSIGAQQVDSSGVALLDTSTLSAGTHHISAVYQGFQDSWNLHAIYQPSTSPAVTVTMNTVTTSTAVSASSSTPTAGTVVTFTASVTSATTVPFGGVSFYDGTALLGTASLTRGDATFSTASLSIGSHSITAVFNANATFATSTSPALNITVAAAPANLTQSLALMELQNSGSSGSVLKAHVVSATSLATGLVTFLDAGRILGTAALDSTGTAVLAFSLGGGTHSLSASFSGDSQFAPAVSPELVEQSPLSGPDFSMELASESVSISPAHSGQLPILIATNGDFHQSIQFACGAGLPSGYICAFSPSALVAGGTTYLTLQPVALPGSNRSRTPLYGLATGLLALFAVRGRKRCLRRGLAFSAVLSLMLAACATPSQPVEPPQLRVLSIRATSGSDAGLIVHSAQAIIKILPKE